MANTPTGPSPPRSKPRCGGRRADRAAAVDAIATKLAADARREAKRELRLWSPALYRTSAERGSDGVLALSCAVLDLDRPREPDDVAQSFSAWFHVIHTTWSHRRDRPRLRVVIPLARPVAAADWPEAWPQIAARLDGAADRALSGVGATFALPAVPSRDADYATWVNPGPLLDPEELGLFPAERADDPPPLGPVDGSPWWRDDGKHEFLDAE
jgi:hypothetical protein